MYGIINVATLVTGEWALKKYIKIIIEKKKYGMPWGQGRSQGGLG
jgi:hypothetical protein